MKIMMLEKIICWVSIVSISILQLAVLSNGQEPFVLFGEDGVGGEGELVIVDGADVSHEQDTYVLVDTGDEVDYPNTDEVVEGEEYNVGYPTCDKIHDDGTITKTLFDECTSFCCGGDIYLNQTGLDCCGSVYFGNPYFSRIQSCCEWWTGHGQGHLKRHQSRWGHSNIGCCGQHRVVWGQQSCCYGTGLPSVFNPRYEICCDGNALPTRTQFTWQSSCCGTTASYDKRTQSCPCRDGSVLDLPSAYTECCESTDGYKSPFIRISQICCNGNVGEADTDFCCGDTMLGTYGEHVCCDGLLQIVSPPNKALTKCCDRAPFDPNMHLCCDGELVERSIEEDECCGGIPINSEISICCDGQIRNRELDGTECCGPEAFFPNTGSFCCHGVVMLIEAVDGDSCCGIGPEQQFYYESENIFICCENVLSMMNGDSCCGIISYSSENSICCDGEVFDRTLGDTCCNGSPYYISHPSSTSQTICCENGPYGPFMTPSCCNGVGYDIQGGQVCCSGIVFGIYRQPACCIDVGYDVTREQCCNGRLILNPEFTTYAQCCGDFTFNPSKSLCCDGIVIDIPEGMPSSKATCCESSAVYDPSYQLCCQGKLFMMESRTRNKCCGDVMYDNTKNLCCGEDDALATLYSFEHGKEDTKCCGPDLYDASKQYCCEGLLEDNVYEESGCCAGMLFNRKEQICCDNMLREIGKNVPWNRAECCGNKCYFPGPMRCCNDRIYIANTRTLLTCVDY